MPRGVNGFIILTLLIGLLGIAACQGQEEAPSNLPTVASPAHVTRVSTVTATTSREPSATPTSLEPSPTASPTLLPTATPVGPFAVAVPPQWSDRVSEAIEGGASGIIWHVISSPDPHTLLENGAVQAALLPNGDGYGMIRLPLALAAPFLSEWDDLTLEEAQRVQTEGHPTISLLPWDELTVIQRALTINGRHPLDADYPLFQAWSLHAAPDAGRFAEDLAGRLTFAVKPRTVKLAAVGDIMLDRALGEAIAAGHLDYPFSFVADLLQGADYTIGNLESALGDRGEAVAKSYTFRAPPAAAQSLALSGFDLVSLANNHALDFGPQALEQGLTLLNEQGIATIGAGADVDQAYQPHIVTLDEITIGFLGYVNVPVEGRSPYFDTGTWTAGPETPGLAWADPQRIATDVEQLVNKVNHVVVVLHSGYEYVPAPSPEQVAAAQAAIDAGATLVIGHHAHILQGVAFRESGAIVYGLGNFAFNIDGSPETTILEVWLDEENVRQLRFIPAIIETSGQPRVVTGADATAIRRRIYALSRFLN